MKGIFPGMDRIIALRLDLYYGIQQRTKLTFLTYGIKLMHVTLSDPKRRHENARGL
jgi:hypothetical protein